MFSTGLYVAIRLLQHSIEALLSTFNRRHYLDSAKQAHVKKVLNIPDDDFLKTLSYTEDRGKYSKWAGNIQLSIFLVFLWFGGFGYVETLAKEFGAALELGPVFVGLIFFLEF